MSEPMVNLSLVIPCYNESSRIANLKKGLTDFISQGDHLSFEIVLVNDGSRDDTLIKLQWLRDELTLERPSLLNKITVIEVSRNLGKGGALREGIRASRGNWILTVYTGPHKLDHALRCK